MCDQPPFSPALRRRDFLRILGYGTLGIVAGSALAGCGGGGASTIGTTRAVVDLSNRFVAVGINDHQQIVGGGNAPNAGPVLWPNTFLPALSGWQLQTMAGINNLGDIVGYATFQGELFHAYLLKRSGIGSYTITDLGHPYIAVAINDYGQIIGAANGASSGPVLWQNGQIVDLNTLLSSGSGWKLETAAGINNNGDIVGYGTFQGDPKHGYLLQQQAGGSYTITDLSNKMIAVSINNSGQIVGGGNGVSGGPVLWQNGQIVDLNSLLPSGSGWQLGSAAGINNLGDIVGFGIYKGEPLHGYWFRGAV